MNSGFATTMVADVPDGTFIDHVALKSIPNVSWFTYLNMMHMNIKCILEESGFLDLQNAMDSSDGLCGHYVYRFSSMDY